MVVSFGVVEGADKWLEDTGCKFPMFLDPERKLYRNFGLHRSLAKVFSIDAISYQAGELAKGRSLIMAFEGIEDDPLQMGGNFSIHVKTKKMRLFYPSKSSADRPSVEMIIKA